MDLDLLKIKHQWRVLPVNVFFTIIHAASMALANDEKSIIFSRRFMKIRIRLYTNYKALISPIFSALQTLRNEWSLRNAMNLLSFLLKNG